MKSMPHTGIGKSLGFSLIELMVAMVLGLLVVGAAIGIFLSNSKTYRATESLGRVQEGVRTAFELMARDVREAAGNPCVNNLPISNVLNNSTSAWWSDLNQWGNAFRGYGPSEVATGLDAGTGAGQRIANTEVVQLFAADENVATITAHDTASAKFSVNVADHGILAGDLAVVCNARQASIFQVSAVNGQDIFHGVGGTPGNCTTGLGVPMNCGAGTTFAYTAPNSVLVKLHVARWYIGNGVNGPALYQQIATANGSITTQEVAEGVTNLSVLYLVSGRTSYQAASTIGAGEWSSVTAARITMSLSSEDVSGTDGEAVVRQLINVVSLRNRNP
ncbi:type IV pilus assembly protein PilW [Xanthomonas arboricola]|uniref:PilW family protein n=1 Tax=Xanthomonas campestris TaxID=339 RepID=UPI002167943C|nr:PilW family protein [Xanthomonas campestris]MCS3848980.1 type IV pilus assembly protein PilW [Xanthomonas campestris]MCW2004991.1 type IV pilus assembly protein PilW [Xanthomonas campestris]